MEDSLIQRFKAKTNYKILDYIRISLIGYSFIFLSVYCCVELLGLNDELSVAVIYFIWYIMQYGLHIKSFAPNGHDSKNLRNYIVFIGFNYFVTNGVYALISLNNWNYEIKLVITIFVMFPLRFLFINKVLYNKSFENG
jgi:hypothetical protein